MFRSADADWITIKKGSPVYLGRLSRRPFERWLNTTKGARVLAAATTRVRFALFNKEQVAARRLWVELASAGADPAVAAAIQQEVDGFLHRLGHLVYSDGLPQVSLGLRRLVVLPCVMVNSASYGSIEKNLAQTPAIAALGGGSWLRDFLYLEILRQIERAIASADPSVRKPLPVTAAWLSVGFNRSFSWHVPFKGPAWQGHHLLLEVTHEPISRGLRRTAAERVKALESTLAGLSKGDRDAVLKRASSSQLITSFLESA